MKQAESRARTRLLTVVCNFDTGGTEGQVLKLMKNLDRNRFDSRVVCLEKKGILLEDYEAQGIPVDEFRIGKLYSPYTFSQIIRLALYIREHRIQVVHCYNFYALMIGIPAAKLAGVQASLAAIRDRGVYLTRAKKLVQRVVCKYASDILVNADSIRDWLLEEGYPSERISVIKNAIDIEGYKSAPSGTLRSDFDIPPSARIVVMISRLNRQKGVEEYIRAAGIVGRNNPDIYFLLVGKPSVEALEPGDRGFSDFDHWTGLIKKFGMGKRILFTGNRTDIPSVLRESVISVLPSHSEGLSNVLLESMAAGVPTIASDTGGNPELVSNEVNGLLVPVRDHQALARAMTRILEDRALADRFSRQAVDKAQSDFSIDRMMRDTQSVYITRLNSARKAGEKQFSL